MPRRDVPRAIAEATAGHRAETSGPTPPILVTAERMREMDRRTIEGGLVEGLVLMERAGAGVLRSILSRVDDLHRRRIWIVCGRGNNGGDGLVLARLLRRRGLHPRVLLTVPRASLSGDAATNADL